jgi:hypothetical protein
MRFDIFRIIAYLQHLLGSSGKGREQGAGFVEGEPCSE